MIVLPHLLVGSAVGQSLQQDLLRAATSPDTPVATTSADAASPFQQLATQAANAYRAGDKVRAIEGFDQAAAEAFRVGASGAAFEYAIAAAEITRSVKDQAGAAERFRRAALSAVRDPRSAAAHEAACVATGAAFAASGSPTSAQLDAYQAVLDEHQTLWPTAPSATGMRRRAIELLAARRDAARLLNQTSAEQAQAEPWLVALRVQAHGQVLASAATPAEHTARLAAATEELQPLVLGTSRRWPDAWTPLQRQIAIVLGRGHLARDGDGPDYARRVLSVAVRSDPPPQQAWLREALPLLATATLAVGRAGEAHALLVESGVEPAEADRALSGLAERLAAAAPDHRAAAVEALAERLGWRASARSRAAPAAAEEKGSPLAVARRALVEAADADSRRDALEAWTALERRSTRSSDLWREARRARLRLLIDLKEVDQARKLLRLTQLLAAEGDADWRAVLTALEHETVSTAAQADGRR
ncbi:hypothetical protein Pla111_15640 [Botrimarina hoheduenensis]|uniref:Uncharacterized protein n=2 Tax=Botrimarina hoheduenensis TaxID=2528000 RepID=A0A5C5W668_9BACT|nr:hypothetical protein Pla111_15640 [Botrimarina hoheduenensis]